MKIKKCKFGSRRERLKRAYIIYKTSRTNGTFHANDKENIYVKNPRENRSDGAEF